MLATFQSLDGNLFNEGVSMDIVFEVIQEIADRDNLDLDIKKSGDEYIGVNQCLFSHSSNMLDGYGKLDLISNNDKLFIRGDTFYNEQLNAIRGTSRDGKLNILGCSLRDIFTMRLLEGDTSVERELAEKLHNPKHRLKINPDYFRETFYSTVEDMKNAFDSERPQIFNFRLYNHIKKMDANYISLHNRMEKLLSNFEKEEDKFWGDVLVRDTNNIGKVDPLLKDRGPTRGFNIMDFKWEDSFKMDEYLSEMCYIRSLYAAGFIGMSTLALYVATAELEYGSVKREDCYGTMKVNKKKGDDMLEETVEIAFKTYVKSKEFYRKLILDGREGTSNKE